MSTSAALLTPDELLTTTRAVRKRLDFTRPVERAVLEECLRIAQQAPTASNEQAWHFVVVTDVERRVRLAELYRSGADAYLSNPNASLNRQLRDPALSNTAGRVRSSAAYLADHLHEVPVHVIPCIAVRPERLANQAFQASAYGSILPAAWSFMLAARARGLGTCWTTLHLLAEEEAAGVLGIPFDKVAQVGLIPVAYTLGDTFAPAPRQALESVVHWEQWSDAQLSTTRI
jgi:nitroreductase